MKPMNSEADSINKKGSIDGRLCSTRVGKVVISRLWLNIAAVIGYLASLNYVSNNRICKYGYGFKKCIRLRIQGPNGTDTNTGFCIRITEIPNTAAIIINIINQLDHQLIPTIVLLCPENYISNFSPVNVV